MATIFKVYFHCRDGLMSSWLGGGSREGESVLTNMVIFDQVGHIWPSCYFLQQVGHFEQLYLFLGILYGMLILVPLWLLFYPLLVIYIQSNN